MIGSGAGEALSNQQAVLCVAMCGVGWLTLARLCAVDVGARSVAAGWGRVEGARGYVFGWHWCAGVAWATRGGLPAAPDRPRLPSADTPSIVPALLHGA